MSIKKELKILNKLVTDHSSNNNNDNNMMKKKSPISDLKKSFIDNIGVEAQIFFNYSTRHFLFIRN